ncbi:unnamed protein product, partial [Allacma fusca]
QKRWKILKAKCDEEDARIGTANRNQNEQESVPEENGEGLLNENEKSENPDETMRMVPKVENPDPMTRSNERVLITTGLLNMKIASCASQHAILCVGPEATMEEMNVQMSLANEFFREVIAKPNFHKTMFLDFHEYTRRNGSLGRVIQEDKTTYHCNVCLKYSGGKFSVPAFSVHTYKIHALENHVLCKSKWDCITCGKRFTGQAKLASHVNNSLDCTDPPILVSPDYHLAIEVVINALEESARDITNSETYNKHLKRMPRPPLFKRNFETRNRKKVADYVPTINKIHIPMPVLHKCTLETDSGSEDDDPIESDGSIISVDFLKRRSTAAIQGPSKRGRAQAASTKPTKGTSVKSTPRPNDIQGRSKGSSAKAASSKPTKGTSVKSTPRPNDIQGRSKGSSAKAASSKPTKGASVKSTGRPDETTQGCSKSTKQAGPIKLPPNRGKKGPNEKKSGTEKPSDRAGWTPRKASKPTKRKRSESLE